jgi:hypothetical protein
MVVLPSATFPVAELMKITAIEHYEERMLFTTLLLRHPDLRIVYLSSLPIDDAIVDYYLHFLPDPDDARRRLSLVAVGESGPRPLSDKVLGRSDVIERVRELAGDPEQAYVLPFNVTRLERAVSDDLGLPLYGPHPDVVWLGSKTGSRQVARRAGVNVLPGREGLFSVAEVARAIEEVRSRRPSAEAVVIKLDNGFSGQGNAIIELAGLASPLEASKTTFCAGEESWPSFATKIATEGAIVEELVRKPDVVSPSVQLRIAPGGSFEVLSTHDQILGGPEDQVYLGCRFPAHPSYRGAVQEAGAKVAEVLAGEGVIGSFGIDFLVVPADGGVDVYLSEINLRMGGTTHPFWMTRLATEGSYDEASGELVADGRTKAYVATDNLKSARLVGISPVRLIETVHEAGLGYGQEARTGTTLHLLGALPTFGKMGVTCIADSPADAEDLYREVTGLLGA